MRVLLKPIKKPKELIYETIESQPNYGKFIAQPFEKGFATTIGNALRRTLLSSIEGSAITAIKIEGVEHEFTSIPGVLEDVSRIILNLKKVRLVYETEHKDEPKVIHIEKRGAGIFTAGDLAVDSSIQILNPELVIATLNEDAELIMDLQIEYGRGYVSAEAFKKNIEEIGTIPIDALFSPIQKVNFTVEELSKGTRNEYEKLIIEIWTDSSIKPEDALGQAAKILKDQLSVFINFEESVDQKEEDTELARDRRRLKTKFRTSCRRVRILCKNIITIKIIRNRICN
jgi:DNA-directed RNA polymerase subunit alpha